MNRFRIEETPMGCAQSHCDKHVNKMVIEEAQMLSTVHRLLDGTEEKRPSKSGKRMVRYWRLPDDRESTLYKPVHMGHPCTVWATQTRGNYQWAYSLFYALCKEFTHRYGKTHMTEEKLLIPLSKIPDHIDSSAEVTPMPLAMGSNPECMDPDDVIGSYRKYYITKKDRFKMAWTNRRTPRWFLDDCSN